MIESSYREVEGWPLRMFVPEKPGPLPLTLLLHGWMGDEDVMWIFADKLAPGRLLAAPRAIFPAPNSGYSWVDRRSSAFSTLYEFEHAVEELIYLITQIKRNFPVQDSPIDLVGFSQGAALAFAFAATHPEIVRSVSGLAGFVPTGVHARANENLLDGIQIFWAHGTRDDIVPIEKGREGVKILRSAGAAVTLCEADVAHKLGAECLRGLANFQARLEVV